MNPHPLHNRVYAVITSPQTYKLVRFVVSGGISALTNLTILFILVESLHVYYLAASVVSFVCAIAINFLLQKLWTFRNRTAGQSSQQFLLFVAINVSNILLNTVIMYTLVSLAGLHYLLAQIASAAVIAVISYLAYQKIVFVR